METVKQQHNRQFYVTEEEFQTIKAIREITDKGDDAQVKYHNGLYVVYEIKYSKYKNRQ